MIYSDNTEDHSGLKYTKVESQQTAFIQSPSLSNKIPYNYFTLMI